MDSEDYPTQDGVDETTASKDTGEPSGDDTNEKMEGETSLLPKSFFQGKDLEVGGECKVKIVHLYDDEAEVEYVPHDSKPTPDDETMESAMGKMDSLGTDSM